jgi:hypothetical protein
MRAEDFLKTTSQALPPENVDAPLKALWWDSRGEWNKAHAQVDELETARAMLVHAYLHRKQGDAGNAAYWYRQAGRAFPACSLAQERASLIDELLLDLPRA